MRLRERARALKREAIVLWLAARDPRTPFAAKLLAGLVAAYALSPVDLIPDFIPVLGLLDDLVIVPLGAWAVLRMLPAPLLEELRARAAEIDRRPVSRSGAAIIVAIWVVAVAWLARALLS